MKYVIVLIIVMFFLSCTTTEENNSLIAKNIKIFENSNIDSVVNIDFERINTLYLNEILKETIKIQFIELDDSNNCYIYDKSVNRIHKITDKGNYLNSFGSKGSGPGEYLNVGSMFIFNNKIYLTDLQQKKIIIYNLDGVYQGETKSSNLVPTYCKTINNRQILSLLVGTNFKNNKIELAMNLSILDSNFTEKEKIFSSNIDMNPKNIINMDTKTPIYATRNNNIYVSRYDVDKYEITLFNSAGIKQSIIKRNYRRINYSKEELHKMQSELTSALKKLPNSSDLKYDRKYKQSIQNIYVDKNNCLFIRISTDYNNSTVNDNANFDIIDNGKLLGKIQINYKLNSGIEKIVSNEQIIFHKDLIYVINYDDNTLDVLSYF